MKTCSCCGRQIKSKTWYWIRKTREGGKLKIERFCWDCASAMVDEHHANGLLHAYEK